MATERPVYIDIKVSAPPPAKQTRYTWWATVDRHPFSDQRGYEDEATAKAMAEAWVSEHYPDREISYATV